MKLLLDEMYPPAVAEQLRARGYDVVSVHEVDYRWLESVPDETLFVAALAEDRALVTENVPDFRRLENEALARGGPHPVLIFTSNRQFPRGQPATVGRLVAALQMLLGQSPMLRQSHFLKPPPSS